MFTPLLLHPDWMFLVTIQSSKPQTPSVQKSSEVIIQFVKSIKNLLFWAQDISLAPAESFLNFPVKSITSDKAWTPYWFWRWHLQILLFHDALTLFEPLKLANMEACESSWNTVIDECSSVEKDREEIETALRKTLWAREDTNKTKLVYKVPSYPSLSLSFSLCLYLVVFHLSLPIPNSLFRFNKSLIGRRKVDW